LSTPVEYVEMLLKIRLSSLLAAVFAASAISVRESRMMIRTLPNPTALPVSGLSAANVITWGRHVQVFLTWLTMSELHLKAFFGEGLRDRLSMRRISEGIRSVSNSMTPRSKAIVFKTRALDACRLQRFESLARVSETMPLDVWVLQDQDMESDVAVDFALVASRYRRVFSSKTPTLDPKQYPDMPLGQGKEQKWSFALWLNQSKYESAWYVEDDFVFTGEWHTFFRPAELKAESSDLVMQWTVVDSTWYHAKSCEVRAQKCLQNDAMVKSRLALFRMSHHFASEWLSLRARRLVKGYDEALVATVCDRIERCRRSEMHFPGGVYVMGRWGIFKAANADSIYKLRVLASFDRESNQVNYSKFRTNADVPRDQIFHPVKCEAEDGAPPAPSTAQARVKQQGRPSPKSFKRRKQEGHKKGSAHRTHMPG
jgi:hypothetical protein